MLRKILLVLLSVLAVVGLANRGRAAVGEPLAVYAGDIVYANPIYDSVALVEFPFTVNRDEFQFYHPDSSGDNFLYARVFAQVDLISTEGYPVDSARTLFSLKVNDEKEAAAKNFRIFNKLILMVKPGIYTARLTVIDAKSKREGSYFIDKITVNPPVKSGITIGGSFLAYDLKYVGEDDPRYNPRLAKNGFNVLINPINIFSVDDTLMYLYSELYNLPDTLSDPRYMFGLTIFDDKGGLFRPLGSLVRKSQATTTVVTEPIDIKNWPAGNYRLEMVATDVAEKVSDTFNIPFHIISPQAVQLAAAKVMGGQNSYDSLSVDDKVHLVKYLLTPEQATALNSLTDSGKLNYLAQYWREHDTDPTTPIIENQIETVRRYEFVNRFFSTNAAKTNGWLTDRGRIYMTYGPWDEKDDFETPRIGNPFVVWYYRSIKEGKLFIFEDYTGNSDYRLVHSNVKGEVYSKDWQDRINQGFIDIVED